MHRNQPSFSPGQSNRELLWVTLGAIVMVILVVLGTFLPIIEDIMTWAVVGLVCVGFILWLCGRLKEQAEWHEALTAPVEELKEKYPQEYSCLKRDYPNEQSK